MVRLFCFLLTLTASLPAATYVLSIGGTTSRSFLGQAAGSAWSASVRFDPADLNVHLGSSYDADSPGDIDAVLTIGSLTGTANIGGNFFVADAVVAGNDQWSLNIYPFFPGFGGPYWLEITLLGGPNVWGSTALPLDNRVFQQLNVSREMSLVDSCFNCTIDTTGGSITFIDIQQTPEPRSAALIMAGLAVMGGWRQSRRAKARDPRSR